MGGASTLVPVCRWLRAETGLTAAVAQENPACLSLSQTFGPNQVRLPARVNRAKDERRASLEVLGVPRARPAGEGSRQGPRTAPSALRLTIPARYARAIGLGLSRFVFPKPLPSVRLRSNKGCSQTARVCRDLPRATAARDS